MIINHPLLGPRDISEFVYLGDASLLKRPAWDSNKSEDEFYEYLYLRETTLISKDEMVSFIKKRFEDGLTFEKLELIIENKDLLAWRDVLIEHGGKKWETTNVQLWKDNKVWRDVVSVRDLEKEDRI